MANHFLFKDTSPESQQLPRLHHRIRIWRVPQPKGKVLANDNGWLLPGHSTRCPPAAGKWNIKIQDRMEKTENCSDPDMIPNLGKTKNLMLTKSTITTNSFSLFVLTWPWLFELIVRHHYQLNITVDIKGLKVAINREIAHATGPSRHDRARGYSLCSWKHVQELALQLLHLLKLHRLLSKAVNQWFREDRLTVLPS